jgi:hypothetical protein
VNDEIVRSAFRSMIPTGWRAVCAVKFIQGNRQRCGKRSVQQQHEHEYRGNGNSLTQWGMQAIQDAYQKTSNAISKNIKRTRST